MEHLGHIAANLEPFVRHYGVFAVSLLLAFESLGVPLPGETLLIFASVLAQRGEMSLPALLIFAWAGSVLGDNVGYLIGKTICRATITGYGGKIGLTDSAPLKKYFRATDQPPSCSLDSSPFSVN